MQFQPNPSSTMSIGLLTKQNSSATIQIEDRRKPSYIGVHTPTTIEYIMNGRLDRTRPRRQNKVGG
jgi:hypothetical protein